MKKNFLLVIGLFLSSFLFMSFSPSLDGRAVVADEGVLPQGIFAKTVGYLPGDSISVTNLSDKTTVDILVIGALDPSEGVAILLSPEAAKLLGISKDSNNVVKITKRSGQSDEAVAGTAVIGNSGKTSSETESDIPELAPPSYDDENQNSYETVPSPEVSSALPAEQTIAAETAVPVETVTQPLSQMPEQETVQAAEETSPADEKSYSESAEPVQSETPEETPLSSEKIVAEQPGILAEEKETETAVETAAENPLENASVQIEKAEETLTAEKIENEAPETEKIAAESEKAENEAIEAAASVKYPEENGELSEKLSTSSDGMLSEKVDLETEKPDFSSETISERITKDGEPYPDLSSMNGKDTAPVFYNESAAGEKVLPDQLTDAAEFDKKEPEVTDVEEEVPVLTGPEKDVSQVPFEEEDIPENYEEYLQQLRAQKQAEAIVPEKINKENIDAFGNKYEKNDAPVEVTNQTEEDLKKKQEEAERAAKEAEEAKAADEAAASLNTESETESSSESVETEEETVSAAEETSENTVKETEKSESLNIPAETEKSSESSEEEETAAPSAEEKSESYEPIVLVPVEPAAEKPAVETPGPAAEAPVSQPAEKTEEVKETVPVEQKTEQGKPIETKPAETAAKPVETKPASSNVTNDFSNYTAGSLKDLKSGYYYIQIAVLKDKSNIKSIFDKYLGKYPLVLVPLQSGAGYQVMVGPLNVDEYGTVLQRFKSYGYKDAFLRKIK